MKQFGPRFAGPKEAIAGTLALLALSPFVAGMVMGAVNYEEPAAPVAVVDVEQATEESHCPDDILSTYWDQANVVLAEHRETHPRPSDPDKRSPINGQGPEYNAIEQAFRDGWPAFAASHNCRLNPLELPIGDLE